MSDDILIRTISKLKAETLYSNSHLVIKNDGNLSYVFPTIKVKIESNNITNLLRLVIHFIGANRVYIPNSININYKSSNNQYTKIKKYKLIKSKECRIIKV